MALEKVKLENISRGFFRALTINICNAAVDMDVYIPTARNIETIL